MVVTRQKAAQATMTRKSYLLSLPLELRAMIYIELLCPNPRTTKLLYHDRKARLPSLDLYPQILRLNKQIYHEAYSYLYNNQFELQLLSPIPHSCMGSSYRKHPDPENGQPRVRGETLIAPPLFRSDPASVWLPHRDGRIAPDGLMYPRCFKRLRHIEIKVSINSVLASCRSGFRFSFTGDLLLDILCLLISEDTYSETRTGAARVVIVKNDSPLWCLASRTEGERAARGEICWQHKMNELLELMRELKTKRILLIEESFDSRWFAQNRSYEHLFDSQ